MTLLVPEKTTGHPFRASFPELRDLLVSALEFLGASAGWIGLQDAEGRLTFPVHDGAFPDNWHDWQQGRSSVWGVAGGGAESALLNDLRSCPLPGDPPLRNLLSCPLIHRDQILGHIALANKPNGFAAKDAAVLQGLAHHLVRLLGRCRPVSARKPLELAATWRRILDGADAAVLLLDEDGCLFFVNAIWLAWTGFRAEELLGQTAPFPFWAHPEDLQPMLSPAPAVTKRALPFRRRDQLVFWCLLETQTQRWDDQTITVAFLQQTPASEPRVATHEQHDDRTERPKPPSCRPATPDWLPLLLDLDGGIEGWGARWEQRTGISARDVEGSPCDLMLDWLFPRQSDRDRVADCFQHGGAGCQLALEIATPCGNLLVLCTFLPWAAGAGAVVVRRWLLLVGEPIPAPTLDGSMRLMRLPQTDRSRDR